MKSMAVTKPDMALLSQEELTQATFGALCQSFAMQILDRGGYQDGMYQRVALEFLEEETEQNQQPVQNVFNIDLNVVLETIRKEAQEYKREKKQTEKLLEQVLQIQQAAEQKQTPHQQTSQAERTYLLAPQHTTITRQSITVHNSFHQHGAAAQSAAENRQLRQAADRAGQEVRTQPDLPGLQTRPIPGGPGSLSSRTTQFVKRVQEGQDPTQPVVVQEKPVIPGRKIEAHPTLQQAFRPAAEMELKQEPAQTPETGKAAADAVVEAVKTAVERQLQQMQPMQAPAKTNVQRQPETQAEGQPSRPAAQQKQGRPITEHTTGRKTQEIPSVTHIQRQEQPAAAPEETADRRETERAQMLQPMKMREPLTQTLRQDIRIANGRKRSSEQKKTAETVQSRPAGALEEAAPLQTSSLERTSGKKQEDAKTINPHVQILDTIQQGAQPTAQPNFPPMRATEELAFREETEEHPQETRPLAPEYTKLLQTYATNLTEKDLQFLSDSQRAQVQEAIKQQPIGQRDIRVTVPAETREQPAAQPNFPPMRATEELAFREETEEHSQETRPLAPEYTKLLQTYATNLTEKDLQFLSDSQRAQVQEAFKQQPIGQRDIRVTGSGLEPAVAQEPAEQRSQTMFLPATGMEELSFRQEAEQLNAQPTQRAETQNEKADGRSRGTDRTVSRDIRVLTEPAGDVPAGQKADTPFGIAAQNLTEADLNFLTESQRKSLQNDGIPPQTETVSQMLHAAAMEELQHRPVQQEFPGTQPAASVQSDQMRAAPADIRVLRQLGTVRPMGQQTQVHMERGIMHRSPSPVDLQLPTGSDAGQSAAQQRTPSGEQSASAPVELTYSPAMVLQQSQPPQDPTARTAGPKPAGSYVSSLPQWAQNFVRSGSPTPVGIQSAAPMSGVARDISSLPGGVIGGESQMMDWSSPNREQLMNQATRRPAEVVFKEKSQEETQQSRPVQMSESELRRTADKIYHMIEDRIRRERRLLGL